MATMDGALPKAGGGGGKPNVIYPLQYLRAIAAFGVVLCHASYYVMESRGDGRMWGLFDRAGGLGVALFFAISGYLMASLAQTTSPIKFLVHRVIRIYPIYWLCVLLVVLAAIPFGLSIRPDINALLLVPGVSESHVLGVEWTLPFELTFYVIVFLVMLVGAARFLPIIAVAWVVVIQVFLVARPDLQQGQFPGLFHLPLSAFSLPFAMGLLVPWLVQRGWVGAATPLLGFAFLVMSESMVNVGPGLFYGFSALGCTLLVAWAVRPQSAQTVNQPLLMLGDWSYALYLCHVPIIRAFCWLMPESVGTIQLWFAAVGLPLIGAVALGKVDIWMYRILKRRVDASSVTFKRGLSMAFLLVVFSISVVAYWRDHRASIEAKSIEPVGQRIAEAMAQGGDLASAVRKAGFKPNERLRGHFDSALLLRGEVRVHGWAADLDEGKVTILVFRCGRYLGAAPRDHARPDVAQSLGVKERESGFLVNLPQAGACDSRRVDGVVLGADGGFSTMFFDLE